ncbi:DUF5957 family protein [Gracilibacillus timonensis]|uniref:DUF5957 family protein n=1 Tax=Gracilibacillus timonensis TaxID=1816696 RepID=UPI000824CD16|nr:DUF5957 family protein [Gracilibacillus timonensis]
MRTMLAIIIGIVGGFIVGIALSSLIGIIGMTVFGVPLGIKFLPYYMAVICAVLVPIVDSRRKNG